MRPLELYIHIPFCKRKCNYCDFLSAPSTLEERKKYVESLCRKIRSYGELAKAYVVVTIFVGGGTPSILEPEQMEAIFEAVRDTFCVKEDAEISLEMNPGTVDRARLQAYRKCGINRLSIGLQSASNEELKLLGRIHTYEDFLDTYRLAREEGFDNINVDLMSAIPGQTLMSYEATVRKVMELKPEHISAYSLIIEEGTPFYERYGDGRHDDELPDEETERLMYQRTRELLGQEGYIRYEISNYAKQGYECRHNLGYWDRVEYLGIGDGAASLIDNRRWTEGEEPEELTPENQMEEYMFLGLRKMEGVSIHKFEETFERSMGDVYGEVLKDMVEKELLKIRGDYVRLTERGIDVSNSVMCGFLFE